MIKQERLDSLVPPGVGMGDGAREVNMMDGSHCQ